jgi:hypothetical protein
VSEVSDNAAVRTLLADYAVIDAAGKLNVVGGGVTGVGQNPNTGLTLPFALYVSVTVPPGLYDKQCSVEIALEDAAGKLVNVPGPAPDMPTQPLRVGQAVTLEGPRFNFPQQVNVPRRYLPARAQWVMSFATGLPLAAGQGYTWRVRIDGETRDDWVEKFVVFGPAPGPVIG